MPQIHIQRSALINAPVEKVYRIVKDFSHWTAWSPWLIMEPEASVHVNDDGSYYEWEGKRVGSGNMNLTGSVTNTSVDYDLTFLKPFKSRAKVHFDMESSGPGTKLVWHMDTSLPFFLFWMKKSTMAYVGSDFERGLRLLKDYAEDGKVHSELNFLGEENYPGCNYVGIKTECSIPEISAKMKEDFTNLGKLVIDHALETAGQMFSIYHKWDLVNQKVIYTAALSVSHLPDSPPAGTISGSIPETKTYTLRHTGPYPHLGNAWGALYMMQRNKSFKINKSINPFEVYLNTPMDVTENELITDIHFPIK